MTAQLIAVDAAALDRVLTRMEAIEALLSRATIQPAPEWVSISQAARMLDCSADTIRRRIAAGEMEAEGAGKARRVKLP